MTWIDRYGDRDGDGYVEYERRIAETGLDNQCWKDSWDSIAFADGTIAPTPRATCELQGYVYDAKVRTARLARDVWGDPGWATALEQQAAELKQRFNRDFWIPERSFFALALDGKKRKVDSLTSNIGHLLWSGIADDDKARSCVQHLMSDELFSGWGVRTMAATEGSYNPIGYHVGTVWPHDNSIIAWGLRRYGYKAESAIDLPRDARGGEPVPRAAARGVRRLSAARDALSGRVPDRVQPAGLGHRRAAAVPAHAARTRLRRAPPDRRPGDPRAARDRSSSSTCPAAGGGWTRSGARGRRRARRRRRHRDAYGGAQRTGSQERRRWDVCFRQSPLFGRAWVRAARGGVFLLRGRGPHAAGRTATPDRDWKAGVLDRGFEQNRLSTGGTGAAPLVGWQPACGQAGAPPQAPARGTPHPTVPPRPSRVTSYVHCA